MTDSPARMQASLFITCIVDQFYPEVGESTVRVLRKLGVDVDFPSTQTCCGQPLFNSGYWSDARPLARRFLKVFKGKGPIVTPSGSCAAMVRTSYAELLRDDAALMEEVHEVSGRVYELSEFIVDVLGMPDLPGTSESQGLTGRKITYHESCHLTRELGAKNQARRLIRWAGDLVEMEQAEVCCGFGGTFAVKYPDISGAMLRDKVEHIGKTGADAVVACDSSCLMQIGGGLQRQRVGVRPMHLAQILDEALEAREAGQRHGSQQ